MNSQNSQPEQLQSISRFPKGNVNRREFLSYVYLGLIPLTAIGGLSKIVYPILLPRIPSGQFGGKFLLSPDVVPLDDSDAPILNTEGRFWLVNTEDGPKALSRVCTHLGCLYKWNDKQNRFECPCHGSKFSREGEYIEGPASHSLDSYPIETAPDGAIMIDTGKVMKGASSKLSS